MNCGISSTLTVASRLPSLACGLSVAPSLASGLSVAPSLPSLASELGLGSRLPCNSYASVAGWLDDEDAGSALLQG